MKISFFLLIKYKNKKTTDYLFSQSNYYQVVLTIFYFDHLHKKGFEFVYFLH